jgi:hypothetical protein
VLGVTTCVLHRALRGPKQRIPFRFVRQTMNHKLLFTVLLFVLSGSAGNLNSSPVVAETRVRTEVLPDKLSDRDFWTMLNEFSEPGGTFVSDKIISNEIESQRVIPLLPQ